MGFLEKSLQIAKIVGGIIIIAILYAIYMKI